MRRLVVMALALGMMLATVSADAGGRGFGGGGRGWSGRSGGRVSGGISRSYAGRARSGPYRVGAAPRMYYRSGYPSAYSSGYTTSYSPSYSASYGGPTYYVSSYPPAVQTVATPVLEVATVAPAPVWYPPPPPPASAAVQPEVVQEEWQSTAPTGNDQYAPVPVAEDISGTLLIAVGSNYSDRTDIPHLRYANSDTKKVYDTLYARQPGPVTGVLLTGPDATRANILSAIDKANNWQGPVVFYFSGHGSPDLTGAGKLGYLVASDTDTSYPASLKETALSLSEIWLQLQTSPAKSVFAAVDICFTGTGKSVLTDGAKPLIVSGGRQAPASEDEEGPLAIDDPASGRILLLSSSANQPSWEDGKKLKGGIFTHYLLAGLKGGAGSKGEVRVQELIRYVKREVQAAARRLKGVDQTPQSLGQGEFVVAGNGSASAASRSASRQLPAGQSPSARDSYARY